MKTLARSWSHTVAPSTSLLMLAIWPTPHVTVIFSPVAYVMTVLVSLSILSFLVAALISAIGDPAFVISRAIPHTALFTTTFAG